jgi:hypothetical protein
LAKNTWLGKNRAETRSLTHYADNMPYTRFDYIS